MECSAILLLDMLCVPTLVLARNKESLGPWYCWVKFFNSSHSFASRSVVSTVIGVSITPIVVVTEKIVLSEQMQRSVDINIYAWHALEGSETASSQQVFYKTFLRKGT
jgi:hypothetical protein